LTARTITDYIFGFGFAMNTSGYKFSKLQFRHIFFKSVYEHYNPALTSMSVDRILKTLKVVDVKPYSSYWTIVVTHIVMMGAMTIVDDNFTKYKYEHDYNNVKKYLKFYSATSAKSLVENYFP